MYSVRKHRQSSKNAYLLRGNARVTGEETTGSEEHTASLINDLKIVDHARSQANVVATTKKQAQEEHDVGQFKTQAFNITLFDPGGTGPGPPRNDQHLQKQVQHETEHFRRRNDPVRFVAVS